MVGGKTPAPRAAGSMPCAPGSNPHKGVPPRRPNPLRLTPDSVFARKKTANGGFFLGGCQGHLSMAASMWAMVVPRTMFARTAIVDGRRHHHYRTHVRRCVIAGAGMDGRGHHISGWRRDINRGRGHVNRSGRYRDAGDADGYADINMCHCRGRHCQRSGAQTSS